MVIQWTTIEYKYLNWKWRGRHSIFFKLKKTYWIVGILLFWYVPAGWSEERKGGWEWESCDSSFGQNISATTMKHFVPWHDVQCSYIFVDSLKMRIEFSQYQFFARPAYIRFHIHWNGISLQTFSHVSNDARAASEWRDRGCGDDAKLYALHRLHNTYNMTSAYYSMAVKSKVTRTSSKHRSVYLNESIHNILIVHIEKNCIIIATNTHTKLSRDKSAAQQRQSRK